MELETSTSSLPKVLVVHAARPSTRQTTLDFLTSFARNSSEFRIQYFNIFQPKFPDLEKLKLETVIISYDILNYRFTPLWKYIQKDLKPFLRNSRFKVALAQDDFWGSQLLDDWIHDNQIDRVLTPIESNLEALYRKSFNKCEFRNVLTGYVNQDAAEKVIRIPFTERKIDLGQRVRYANVNLGTYARQKAVLAEKFASLANANGFAVDVSSKVEDSLVGNDWINFLGNSRFTISMKGGASLIDKKGHLYFKTNNFKQRKPQLTDDEVAMICLKKEKEQSPFKAVSPRLFEAAATKTCQILIEDDYLGALVPWKHYIPLKADFSNADQVFQAMRDLRKSEEIAENCFDLLIESGNYSDKLLVDAALNDLPKFTNQIDQVNENLWSKLINHQKDLYFLQDQFGVVLHDTLIYWLQDVWMSSGTQKLENLVKLINKKNFPEFEKSINIIDRELISLIQNLNFEKWVINRINEILCGLSNPRLVWPWRKVL